jgi:prefoldin subunit 5
VSTVDDPVEQDKTLQARINNDQSDIDAFNARISVLKADQTDLQTQRDGLSTAVQANAQVNPIGP